MSWEADVPGEVVGWQRAERAERERARFFYADDNASPEDGE